jgi:hypothetical protein
MVKYTITDCSLFKAKTCGDSKTAAAGKQYPGIIYAAIQNGWMEGETFSNQFTRNFIRIMHLQRPGMLIYDGHSYHSSVLLVEKARNENTVILKLQTNTIYVTDLRVIWQLKLKWDEEIIKWQRKVIKRR